MVATMDTIIKYPFLIAEDNSKDLRFYKNSIKRACGGKIWLEFAEAESAEEGKSAILENVFPFFSLDKMMPLHKGYEVVEGAGSELAQLSVKLNPLSIIIILTVSPEWQTALNAGKLGVDYIDKKKCTAGEYGKQFVERIKSFERTESWETGANVLPSVLSSYCDKIANKERDQFRKLNDIFFLWDAGIRLLALSQIAVLDYLGHPPFDIYSILQKRLDNNPLINSIERLTPKLIEDFESNSLSVQAREYKRFFSCKNFKKSTRSIQQLRNSQSHSPLREGSDIFSDNIPSFLTFLLGMSYWAIHPIVTNLKVVPWGSRNALQGNRLVKSNNFLGDNEVFQLDKNKDLVAYSEQLYHVILNPENTEEGLVVPLYPLMRIEQKGEEKQIWLAHNPLRDEYRNPQDGTRKTFEDKDLSDWCISRIEKNKTSLASVVTPESNTKENNMQLNDKIRSALSEHYLPDSVLPPEKTDADYQTSFYGIPKAKEILDFLATHNNLSLDRIAYVSIGGADGSEIIYSMKNSPIRHGILLECSDFGASEARKNIDNLSAIEKKLVVFQGDAMQRLNDCSKQLAIWKQNGLINGVILSVQSVLHELPYRSPNFDINVLLGQIFEPFQLRLFYSREPAKPTGWPNIIHIRIPEIPGQVLSAIARQVNDVLGFSAKVDNIADGFVQMPIDLAVETLFKILYCEDSERFRYEMDERLTAFDPIELSSILRNFIKPQENVESQYLISDSFRSRYKSYRVEARSKTGEKLGIPQAFVKIWGIQELD